VSEQRTGDTTEIDARLEFRMLGPLEVLADGESLQLGRGKQRALLARLLLDADSVISVAGLIDDLWGESVPETAGKMVQVYVSQLRKRLPTSHVVTRAPGYALELRGAELDLHRFDELLARGREALGAGRAQAAAQDLRAALALWRGPALAEFSEPFARFDEARLEELRLVCLEDRIEADLVLGRHGDLVGELEALVERHPLRERLRSQLMRAHYGAGRQAEALTAYRAYREQLAEELGMEPSAALRDLERRILQQDPGLEALARPQPAAPSATTAAPAVANVEDVRYARSDDVRIAYQVIGDGPVDLVLVHGWVCTFQPGWENPRIASFYRRLASMGRLILFDKRGTGLSDRVTPERLPDLETRIDDVRAVMDAVRSRRAVIVGISEGGPMSMLFAATHPERTLGLVLVGTFARMMWAPDYTIGITETEADRRLAAGDADDWARSITLEWLSRSAPGILKDEERLRWYVSYVMRGTSPAGAAALRMMNLKIDVRHVLPTVPVPALVLHRDREWYAEASRYVGSLLPSAKTVELQGSDHLPWEGDQAGVLEEVEEFLSELHEEAEPSRVLVTVLFTDLVGSTTKAEELGDRRWHELRDRHYAVIRAQLTRFRGREVATTGDGMLAVFDGPARAVRCGWAIARGVRSLGVEVRAGLHTGEVEIVDGDVRGVAVQIGACVAALAAPGEVLVSQTVNDLVAGSGLDFDDRGMHHLAGISGEWRLLAARDPFTAIPG
jgi:DNA-binding SARP family transcriptional activator/class 3 adenylate cyclase